MYKYTICLLSLVLSLGGCTAASIDKFNSRMDTINGVLEGTTRAIQSARPGGGFTSSSERNSAAGIGLLKALTEDKDDSSRSSGEPKSTSFLESLANSVSQNAPASGYSSSRARNLALAAGITDALNMSGTSEGPLSSAQSFGSSTGHSGSTSGHAGGGFDRGAIDDVVGYPPLPGDCDALESQMNDDTQLLSTYKASTSGFCQHSAGTWHHLVRWHDFLSTCEINDVDGEVRAGLRNTMEGIEASRAPICR